MNIFLIQKPIANLWTRENLDMDFLIGSVIGFSIGVWIGAGIVIAVMTSRADDSCDMVIEETINTLKDKEEDS